MTRTPFPRRRSARREWILPAALARRARRVGLFEIVEHELALGARERRHVVPRRHEGHRLVPALTGQALRGHQLEVMAWCAGIERFLAPGAGCEFFRALVARREGAGLAEGHS